jgi:hypothetical protein
MTMTDLPQETSSQMQLVTVTPSMAELWLTDCNTRNRHLSKSRVEMYASTMKAGLWRHPTGEPLIFDRLGRMQDGQHRLAAQVAASVTVSYWVMTGADPNDFTVIDQGKTRRVGDIIGIDGVTSANQVAAIAKVHLMMLHFPHRVWTGGHTRVVPAQVTAFALENRTELVTATHEADRIRKNTRLPRTAIGAVSFYANQLWRDSQPSAQWSEFVRELMSGAHLGEDSPVLTLRKWAISRSTLQGVSQQLQVSLITKAWNAYVDNRPLTRLVWQNSSMPMPLPKMPIY